MNTKAAINTIARCEARDAVKAELKAQGHKLSEWAPREITKLAQEYLAEHPELLAVATAQYQHFVERAAALRLSRRRKSSQ